MEFRLVIFLVFLTVAAGMLSLGGYKKYYSKDDSFQASVKVDLNKKAAVTEKAAEIKESKPFKLEINTASLKNGFEVYHNKGQCVKCHGDKGQGNAAEEGPLLAGQYDWYIIDQVNQIRSGTRINEKMKPYLNGISDEEIKNVAEYMSKMRIQ